MKRLIKKDLSDLVGDCEAKDLKPFDPNSRAGKLAVRMKDGKLQKSCLKIKDIQRIIQGG